MEIITTDMLMGYLQKNKRQFEELLPELIKKLILSESTPETIRIPGRSDVWVPGFDGVVKLSKKTKRVARGKSYWEFGTQKDYLKKANSDYEKRTAETEESDRQKSSFYFVTPFVWSKKPSINAWETCHNGWKKTTVYDGIVLAEWINSNPSVCAWFMSQFNEVSICFSTVEQAWSEFANRILPPFVESMFLFERDEIKDQLISSVNQQGIIRVQSDFYYDSLGFVLSSLKTDPGLRESAIVINDYDTYISISNMVSDKVLLLNFLCDANLKNNNHTIICFGEKAYSANADISLPSRKRSQFENALREMGMDKDTVSELYRRTHGNLNALIRIKPGTANNPVPEWISNSDLHLLYPLLFLETINRNNEQKLVELLSDEKYEVIEEKYNELARIEDSPLKIVGDYYVIVNFEEVWEYLNPQPEDIHFKRLLKTIICLNDDNFFSNRFYRRKGSVEQQLLSNIVWYSYEHSESVVFATAVNDLLNERALKSKLIYENIYILAEASPDKVLSVLEEDVADLQSYIYQALDSNSLTPILMALDELTLYESTAYRACVLLHKLARIEKDYLFSNTPYNSLSSALSLLNTYSALSINDKVIILKKYIQEDPRWGTRFVSETIGMDHFYRRERIGKKEKNPFESFTYRKYFDAIFELSSCVIDSCNDSGYVDPVISIIDHYWLYSPERLTELANQFIPDSYTGDELVKINIDLHKKIYYMDKRESRKGYAPAFSYWVSQTETDDRILKFAWAFSDYYNCPDVSLIDCITDLDDGKTFDFRANLLSSLMEQCGINNTVQIVHYMDNNYGWGRVINSIGENELTEKSCQIARVSKKYNLLAGCMDCLDINFFMRLLNELDLLERQRVLPIVSRRDFLQGSLSEDDLFLYWSNKTMIKFNDSEYRTLLYYNPFGLLHYCRTETENDAERMIDTIIEIFNSIVEFESNNRSTREQSFFIQPIIDRVDKIYYSPEWAQLCIKLQDLHLIENNSNGINRYIFNNPMLLVNNSRNSPWSYRKYNLPLCAYDNYSEFKAFFDCLVNERMTHLATQIISSTLVDDKEFPLVVMDYLEERSDFNFDKEIAFCITSSAGFTWAGDGTNQRDKSIKYLSIANTFDASHYHTKTVFLTLSKIYANESAYEEVRGEIDL